VPAGESKLEIKTSGGTGDVDLYVKHGAYPSLTDYDYRPYADGNAETVVVSSPTAGNWYVMLHAYQAYSGVSLLADYSRIGANGHTGLQSSSLYLQRSGECCDELRHYGSDDSIHHGSSRPDPVLPGLHGACCGGYLRPIAREGLFPDLHR